MLALWKYRGVIFEDRQDWYKIWRKTDLCFQKWHEQFVKFSPKHLKVSKLGLWWDPFVQQWKWMGLKSTAELCIMTMKNGCKNWREIDLSIQDWREKFDEFWPEYSKISNICTLIGCLWPKYIIFELKR